MFDFLEEENIDPELLRELRAFREANPLPEALRQRIPAPRFHYYGKEVWDQAAAALLCGKNLLLTGGKATGKNVLAENLAMVFGRPACALPLMVGIICGAYSSVCITGALWYVMKSRSKKEA